MFVQKIKELKGTDVCDVFSWAAENLKKYNLVYGWNGSGKTTISRLFNFLERNNIHIPELASIEFSIQANTGVIKAQDLQAHNLSIRVFNEDFIKDNLGFENSKAKKIIIFGKDNVDLQKEIEALESQQKLKKEELAKLLAQQSALPKLDSALTEAGGEVPKQFGNTPLANDKYYGRTYNKTKVEELIRNGYITETNFESLIITDPADLDSKRELIKSEKTQIEFSLAEVTDFSEVFAGANDLLELSINVENIEELDTDIELRDWVERGYHIHGAKKLTSCKFCGNHLDPAVLERLSRYFTDELQKARSSIDDKVRELNNDTSSIALDLDSSEFLPDLSKDYLEARDNVEQQRKVISGSIQTLIERLIEKKKNMADQSKRFDRVDYPKQAIEQYNASAKKIHFLVSSHNQRLAQISKEVHAAAKSIELHTIAKILRDKDYFKNKTKWGELNGKINPLRGETSNINTQITTKRGALQNASVAVEKINAVLKEFFGDSHIYLEVTHPASGEVGYLLKRRGKDAKHLSEGEKSVLALVYFLTKLEEDGFKKDGGLIVIDDPVDSQDAIFLFRTFAFVKRQLMSAGQVILLTHNFEFFNLCRDWLSGKTLVNDSQLYFISNTATDTDREIKIVPLPTLLKQYKSEYQYLFSRLYRYAHNIEELDEPLVPNIARKILEYFAVFKWSCNSTEQLTNIVLNRFVASDKPHRKATGDFVVKFVHEYSHGQDFSRPVSAAMFEAKDIAKQLLKFIELADKEHFNDLATFCT